MTTRLFFVSLIFFGLFSSVAFSKVDMTSSSVDSVSNPSHPISIIDKAGHSQTKKTVSSKTDLSSLSHWPLVIITLVGMVSLILVLAWSVRRFGGSSFSRNKDMHIISSLALGTRERVALIDVKGQKLLLGITAQNVNHLYTFDELSDGSEGAQVLENEFSDKLKNIMQNVKAVKKTNNESPQ